MTKEEKAAYNLEYRLKNADKIKKQKAKHYKENKEKFKKKNTKYRADNPEKIKLNNDNSRKNNSEKIKIYQSIYRLNNKNKIKKYNSNYHKKRKKEDFIYKLRTNISSLIRISFKKKNPKKSFKTEAILGCSLIEFQSYINSKLESWMTEKNYGKYNPNGERTWQIDHIIPLASAKNEEDVIKLNHYTNLRPLCSKENLDKKDKFIL